jgi:hypothetical protein
MAFTEMDIHKGSMMNKTLITGSLYQVSQQSQKPLAELFIDVRAAVIVDVSASMDRRDARDGKSRWQVAGEELTKLQAEMPGQIALFAFSDRVQFTPSGVLPETGKLGSTTKMSAALKHVKTMGLDIDGIRIMLVSDGEPNDQKATLDQAAKFTQRIDTIFVGPEGSKGASFLDELAKASGGIAATADCVSDLADTAMLLLMEG